MWGYNTKDSGWGERNSLLSFLSKGVEIIHFIYGNDTFRIEKRLSEIILDSFADPNDPNISIFDTSFDWGNVKNHVLSLPFWQRGDLLLSKTG
jgi:DNA polymerase III delta subunit